MVGGFFTKVTVKVKFVEAGTIALMSMRSCEVEEMEHIDEIPVREHVPEVDKMMDEGKKTLIDEVLMSLLIVTNQIV